MCVCVYLCVYVCVFVCVCMYVYVYMCSMYMYTDVQNEHEHGESIVRFSHHAIIVRPA